jgi:hypothetical protein
MNRREHIKSLGLLTAGVSVFPLHGYSATKTASSEKETVTLAYRLHPELWTRPFSEIRNGLLKYDEAINEIALFDESLNSRTMMTLNEVRERAKIAAQRIREFKEAGILKAGINLYDDIGVRNFDGGYTFDFRPITGHDGKESWWCPCPNDANMHNYFLEKLKIYAETEPDFIWIDDDYRNANKVGIKYSCFCHDCVDRFGQAPDREALVAKLNQPENQQLREQWIAFMNETLNSLALKIKNAIKGVNPNITIGFMTVGYDLSTYAYDFPTWMKTMEAVKARPGHGYYHEDQPRLIINKLFDVARQVRDFPAITTDIQYELEDWTYTTLNKSVQTELNESLLSLMTGCTGIAYNAIYANEWEEKIRMLEEIAQQKPLWEKVKSRTAGLPLKGFWPVDHPNLMAKPDVDKTGWFQEEYDIQAPNELAEMGIPFCFDPENHSGVFLSGKLVEGFTDDELKKLLSGGVYMDAEALRILWKRGFGEYTGVKAGESARGVEVLTHHRFNEKHAGDGRRPVWMMSGVVLQPQNDEVQQLSFIQTVDGKNAGCCLSAYENEWGGKVTVAGYFPWEDMGRVGKRTQLLNLADWLSNNEMPLRINSFVRVLPLIRMNDAKDEFIATFFNTSYDHLKNVDIEVNANCNSLTQLFADRDIPVKSSRKNGRMVFTIKEISPWQVAVIAGN